MIRLVRVDREWHGLEVEITDLGEMEQIEAFVYAGEPVILCSDLEGVDELIDINGVHMVDAVE